MNKTGIEYLTHTWNPIAMRCTPVSEGCAHCWHLRMCNRHSANPKLGELEQAAKAGGRLYWREDYPQSKKPAVIGVQFMGDLFHERIPRSCIDRVLRIIEECPQHTFLMLTKRPENIQDKFYYTDKINRDRVLSPGQYFPNVWLGVSVENQRAADERIPVLLQTPAVVRFVSYEPALEAVDFSPWFDYRNYRKCEHCNGIGEDGLKCPICGRTGAAYPAIDWIIVGGETGPGARFFNPAWAAAVWTLCQTHMQCYEKTRFFWKGEMAGEPWQVREFPGGAK